MYKSKWLKSLKLINDQFNLYVTGCKHTNYYEVISCILKV